MLDRKEYEQQKHVSQLITALKHIGLPLQCDRERFKLPLYQNIMAVTNVSKYLTNFPDWPTFKVLLSKGEVNKFQFATRKITHNAVNMYRSAEIYPSGNPNLVLILTKNKLTYFLKMSPLCLYVLSSVWGSPCFQRAYYMAIIYQSFQVNSKERSEVHIISDDEKDTYKFPSLSSDNFLLPFNENKISKPKSECMIKKKTQTM